MTLVFDRNIETTELLLHVILGRNDLKVLEVVAQREYKNLVPDVHRARFHGSMLDTKMRKTGQEFKTIHGFYVIFITASDVIGAGCSLYHINRTIEETRAYFSDGSHIIYVNGSYKDDSDPVGRLMHDFRCLSSADMFYPALAKQVKYFKETEGGQGIMCQVFEDLAEKRVLDEKEYLIKNLMETMKWIVEQAMEALKISEEDKEHLMIRF